MTPRESTRDVHERRLGPEDSRGVACSVFTGRIHGTNDWQLDLSAMIVTSEHEMDSCSLRVFEVVRCVAQQQAEVCIGIELGLRPHPRCFISTKLQCDFIQRNVERSR